ncbi:MAG TPA: CBS domain-containing protein [Bryobacteraceae bacterium]|nr:CBS domain-containing protein [Bryobacteraceae bacterium]
MRASSSTLERAADLHEPVKHVLRQKDAALWCTSPDSTVYDAIDEMSKRHIGSLVVMSEGKLAGIVTERDYARKVILQGRHSKQTLVREIMSTPVLYVTPETSAGECMRLMTERRVRHLPVMEGDRVMAVISIGDLVNWLVSSQQDTIHHLTGYIAGAYPA